MPKMFFQKEYMVEHSSDESISSKEQLLNNKYSKAFESLYDVPDNISVYCEEEFPFCRNEDITQQPQSPKFYNTICKNEEFEQENTHQPLSSKFCSINKWSETFDSKSPRQQYLITPSEGTRSLCDICGKTFNVY